MEKKRLPEDVIVEILLRLPVKSLLRFRYVCKSWFDLIKNPYFIESHLKHQSTKNHECITVIRGLEDDETTMFVSIHSYESSGVISSPHLQIPYLNDILSEVYGPCDGIICLSDAKTVALCNPAMREFKVLPPSPFPYPEDRQFRINAIGFGFDSNTNDYKVLAIVFLYHEYCRIIIKAEIYNLSTNSWREIHHDHNLPFLAYDPGLGTLFNGAFHWIAHCKVDSCILSFDMSTEVFRYMELPPDDPLGTDDIRLMVLNESLALLAYTWDTSEFVHVWVMQQYGVAESWTKQVTIGPLFGILRPLLLWKNESILLESSEGRLVSCALDTHEMSDFDIHGFPQTWRVMVYQESLISIK